MSKDKGFILIFRDIREHWLWTDKPFSEVYCDNVFRGHSAVKL